MRLSGLSRWIADQFILRDMFLFHLGNFRVQPAGQPTAQLLPCEQ